MTTAIKIGVGLYLVGVVSLTGMLVMYLSHTPPKARVPRAGWFSAFVGALLWPILAVVVLLGRLRAWRAARRVRRALRTAGFEPMGSRRRVRR